ncbi:MAG: 2-phospho-L-lactate transferase CofD family protein [Solirubrobacteraceae bacterium]
MSADCGAASVERPAVGDVVLLAGGTGGAKLARGMLEAIGPERLVVIANTGDDLDAYGAAVSPDPDLVSFWLADAIDSRGWGLRDDTFVVMDALRALGRDVWFNLGDRDLAWCIERARMLEAGLTPTQALSVLCGEIGVSARVLPMCDSPLRTFVNGEPFQDFMILRKGETPVRDVRFEGELPASVSPQAIEALALARCVIVGPSNPVISIWPILTALREQLGGVRAPVVCVSPVVGGEIVKGPTAAFLDAFGHTLDARGVLAFYEQVAPRLIGGLVADEELDAPVPALCAPTLMDGPEARAELARVVLRFADSLPQRDAGSGSGVR